MRHDFRSLLTHGKDLRYPDAQLVRTRILDDDGASVLPDARARELRKGRCEGNNLRYALLHRYLASQVGRRWDAVRSDLCRALDPALRARLLDGAVEEECRLGDDGTVVDGRGRPVHGPYVDPRDGILRAAPRRSWSAGYRLRERRRGLADPDLVPLTEPTDPDRRVELRRLAGVWYELAYRRSEVPPRVSPRDAVAVVRRGESAMAYEDAVRKRQLPKAEIRRLRLAEWALGAARLAAGVADGRDDPRLADRLRDLRRAAIAACLHRR